MKKKNHTRQLTLKKYLWYGLKKNHTRNLITEKNSYGSKILHHPLSNGPSLCDGEVDLGGHSFFPTPHPLKIPLFSHDGVQLRDVCSTSDTIYYTRKRKVK